MLLVGLIGKLRTELNYSVCLYVGQYSVSKGVQGYNSHNFM